MMQDVLLEPCRLVVFLLSRYAHLLVIVSSISLVFAQVRKAHSFHCASSSHKVNDFAGTLLREKPHGIAPMRLSLILFL